MFPMSLRDGDFTVNPLVPNDNSHCKALCSEYQSTQHVKYGMLLYSPQLIYHTLMYRSRNSNMQFYKRQKILNRSLKDQHFKHYVHLQKYMEKLFFCGHNILTEYVLTTQLSSKVEMSV
jgi:hypothetical protein